MRVLKSISPYSILVSKQPFIIATFTSKMNAPRIKNAYASTA